MDQILAEARAIIADRRQRLRCTEAVTAEGDMCRSFLCWGRSDQFRFTRDHEQAHRLRWKVAGMIAKAARLRPLDEDDAGGSLALLSDTRGQAAVLRAVDTLIDERRPSAHAGEHAMRLLHAALVLLVTAQGADGADALAKLDANGNHIVEETEAHAGGRLLFTELDTNVDDLLQPEELNGRLGAAVLQAADPDADGGLNLQEYAVLITARYKSANANSDGLVDGAEPASHAGQLLLAVEMSGRRQARFGCRLSHIPEERLPQGGVTRSPPLPCFRSAEPALLVL